MIYKECLIYLYGLRRFAKKVGLENVKNLLKLLNNPQEKLKCIHITGTNGKGSTSAFINSILQELGFKVGLFTSPHLTSLRERISVNNIAISKEEIASLLTKISPKIFQIATEYTFRYPIFFEVMTVLALLYFYEVRCDFVIMEVGLGGRVDATNVINPLVSVITNVSLEHTDRLGKTLEAIALEKAGIIKKGIPVVTAETEKNVISVLEEICKKNNTCLTEARKKYKWEKVICTQNKIIVNLKRNSDLELEINMLGEHQIINVITALAAIDFLPLKIEDKKIKEGIKKTFWPGRLEIVNKDPLIILDGAHNPAAFRVLIKALKLHFSDYKVIFILGIFKDKDVDEIIQQVLMYPPQEIVICSINSFRALPLSELKKKIIPYFSQVHEETSLVSAITYAKNKVLDKKLICITGSLHLVGEARKILVKDVLVDD